jgi:hypothetical protein
MLKADLKVFAWNYLINKNILDGGAGAIEDSDGAAGASG